MCLEPFYLPRLEEMSSGKPKCIKQHLLGSAFMRSYEYSQRIVVSQGKQKDVIRMTKLLNNIGFIVEPPFRGAVWFFFAAIIPTGRGIFDLLDARFFVFIR
jgi:hypothetical protein